VWHSSQFSPGKAPYSDYYCLQRPGSKSDTVSIMPLSGDPLSAETGVITIRRKQLKANKSSRLARSLGSQE
jgi:hypothetical protein